MKTYYVYILQSKAGVLYTGFTNNLKKRVYQHKSKLNPGFTSKYDVTKLLYVETFSTPSSGISREKQIKNYKKKKKVALIDSQNKSWQDLSANWYD